MIVTLADPYLAQNAGRRYPLADDTDTTVIPDNAILDFRCIVFGHAAGTVPTVTLTSVAVNGGGRTLTVTVSTGATPAPTLAFDVPANAVGPYTSAATTADGRIRGDLTVSEAVLSVADSPSLSLPFARTTVICDSLKVFSLQAVSPYETGTGFTDVLTGEIVLAAGKNAEPYLDGQALRLDVYKGAGTGEACQSVATGQTCDNVLFSINGEKPGSDGELRLVGTSGVLVTPKPLAHALEIALDETARQTLLASCQPSCR